MKVKPEDILFDFQVNNLESEIEYIQPDYELTISSNDFYFNTQWGINNIDLMSQKLLNQESVTSSVYREVYNITSSSYQITQKPKIDANVVDAWNRTHGEGIVVALIDGGLDIEHEDLYSSIWINDFEIIGDGIDNDSNGFVDDVYGWNFTEDNSEVHRDDRLYDEWHATHLAGIISGIKDNEIGIAGVAPRAKIMPLKVFKNGVAYTSDIIQAIDYAEKMGARVANCSWGTTSPDNLALKNAIEKSNMLFVSAAGNENKNIDYVPVYPASFTNNNVITVTSLSKNGFLSNFSNYGQVSVDVTAPGEDIISTLPGNTYGSSSGTSISAAFVSGEAALILSKDPDLGAEEIRNIIINSSDKLTSLISKVSKGNKINCYNAVSNISITSVVQLKDTKELTITESIYQEVQETGEYNLFSIGNWATKSSMPTPRDGHGVAEVNGKVYAIGGFNSYTRNTVEEYNPYTNTWLSKTGMSTARTGLVTVSLSGKVYAIGGWDGNYLSTVEEYDPSTNQWTTKASMNDQRYFAAASVANGRIYVFGGSNSNGGLNTVEEYNPATNTWTYKASMPFAWGYISANNANQKIYVMGGSRNTVLEYNVYSNIWTTKASMPTSRYGLGVATVNNKIYAIGGYNNTYLNTVEEYNPSSNTWSTKASMPTARVYPGVISVNGKIYAIGGGSGSALGTVEEYEAASDDYGNDLFNAVQISLNNEIPGNIDYTGDVDVFKFIAPISGTYIVYTTGNTDTYGYIYDSAQFCIDQMDDYYTYDEYTGEEYYDSNFHMELTLTAKQIYYIKVRHYSSNGIGGYFIHADFDDDHGNSFEKSTWVSVDNTLLATIEYGGDIDYFRFTAPVSGYYSILTTGDTDTYGYLYDGSMSWLDENDNYYYDISYYNFRINYYLNANQTYYIIVRHYDDIEGIGDYCLNVVSPPQTPTNLTANATNNSITISWGLDSGTSGYDLEIDGTILNDLSNTWYEDVTLQPNTYHTYRVRARKLFDTT